MTLPEQILVNVLTLSQKQCPYPIAGNLAYATRENFLGRIVDGYSESAAEICLLTKETAAALCEVQTDLNKVGLGLYIYDAYRPLSAVRDFAKWFHEPPANDYELERKKIHYPNIEKTDLVPLGYAPDVISRHNFGNAVDLVLIDLKTKQLLDMGTCFDFFDVLSHTTATAEQIGQDAFRNRQILSNAMQKFGFIPYEEEFWHFDFHKREVDEPMDMPIRVER